MTTTKKILVIGTKGMVGSMVVKYLSKKHKVVGISSKIMAEKDIDKILTRYQPFSFIINCIGKLKGSSDFSANIFIPQYLDKLTQVQNFKLIHISTDDVFSPHSRAVNEKSNPNPENEYGRSKLEGETRSLNSITIRSSFLGYDNRKQNGLVNYVLKNNHNSINGFINQNWSGCTTLQFAKFCDYLLNPVNFNKLRRKLNIIHFAPLGPTSKYSLLQDISEGLGLGLKIKKINSPEVITRYLSSTILTKEFYNSYGQNAKKAITELKEFNNK